MANPSEVQCRDLTDHDKHQAMLGKSIYRPPMFAAPANITDTRALGAMCNACGNKSSSRLTKGYYEAKRAPGSGHNTYTCEKVSWLPDKGVEANLPAQCCFDVWGSGYGEQNLSQDNQLQYASGRYKGGMVCPPALNPLNATCAPLLNSLCAQSTTLSAGCFTFLKKNPQIASKIPTEKYVEWYNNTGKNHLSVQIWIEQILRSRDERIPVSAYLNNTFSGTNMSNTKFGSSYGNSPSDRPTRIQVPKVCQNGMELVSTVVRYTSPHGF